MKLLMLLVALCTLLYPQQGNSTHEFDESGFGVQVQEDFILVSKPASPAVLAAKYRMYNQLCFELRDVDCSGIPAPNVKTFERNPVRPTLQGYYDGGDTIHIREDLRGRVREDVLAHEMSHYLDVMILGLQVPGPALDICMSEKRAWAVSDAYWTKYKRLDKVVGEDWVNWYRHCTPLKDVLYPKEV